VVHDSMLIFDKEAMSHNSTKSSRSEFVSESQELPIHPKTFDWKVLSDPERLSKTFSFKYFNEAFTFSLNMMKHMEETKHHATISILDKSITVSTYTHNIDSVTELDIELTKFADSLFEDIKYHFLRG